MKRFFVSIALTLMILLPYSSLAESQQKFSSPLLSWSDGTLSLEIVKEEVEDKDDKEAPEKFELRVSGKVDEESVSEKEIVKSGESKTILIDNYLTPASATLFIASNSRNKLSTDLSIKVSSEEESTKIAVTTEEKTLEEPKEENSVAPKVITARITPREDKVEEDEQKEDPDEENLVQDETETEETLQALMGITFTKELQLEFREWPEYRLSRRSDTVYELVLKDCSVEKDPLLLTYFAPREIEGITYVKPIQKGSDLHIKIHVEDGASLQGRVVSNTLKIKSS